MQAIITKFIPATNIRPSRYFATCERGSITVSTDYALNADENHRAVCDALCARFAKEDAIKYGTKNDCGWTRPKAGGQIPDGRHVFCFIPKRTLERNTEPLKAALEDILKVRAGHNWRVNEDEIDVFANARKLIS